MSGRGKPRYPYDELLFLENVKEYITIPTTDELRERNVLQVDFDLIYLIYSFFKLEPKTLNHVLFFCGRAKWV